MSVDGKNYQQNTGKLNPVMINKDVAYGQVGFIPGMQCQKID